MMPDFAIISQPAFIEPDLRFGFGEIGPHSGQGSFRRVS